ncbi:MAG: hypothetical protein LC637_02640 [Xanthomonadaceae bacterium]|nr:hypothetical protein [Xanthomonadaceae bacterium]
MNPADAATHDELEWLTNILIDAFIKRFGQAGRSSLEWLPAVWQNTRTAASLAARYAALTRVQKES